MTLQVGREVLCIDSQVKMEKTLRLRGALHFLLILGQDVRREQSGSIPNRSIANHSFASPEDLPALETHAHGSVAFDEDLLDVSAGVDSAACFGDAADEGVDHGASPSFGVVEFDVGPIPICKHVSHHGRHGPFFGHALREGRRERKKEKEMRMGSGDDLEEEKKKRMI
jgi:hypothetical protein